MNKVSPAQASRLRSELVLSSSVEFCHKIGLDYVSCSPFRVPIARLAAAQSAGHEVVECTVGTMNIKGCLACEYCHTKGEGKCIQKDDMEKVYPELAAADMVVFASPVHYFAITGQLQSVIARFYAQGKPKAQKYAMLISSASPNVYAGIEGQYKSMLGYFKAEDLGIKEVIGAANKAEATLSDIEAFGASIK